jgi:endonuclease/exonuclease/phosphatase (EEP) superfamily protein YafD
MELPFVRQRRVVPIATIEGGVAEAPITLASVHLDPFVSARRLWLIGAARMRGWQASVVANNLSAAGALVVGGDFNTWRGPDEPAFSAMQRISDPAPWPAQPTFAGGGVLDHLFFRLPDGWRGTYRRAPHSYGSDHFPVVGWIDARPGPPAE